MRTISPSLLAKIQALNQGIFNNANPQMYVKITKVVSDLQVYTIASGTLLGAIDLAIKWTDLAADPNEVWIAEVINHQAVIKVYTYSEDMDFTTPTRTFTLATVGTNARVKYISIEFDGSLTDGQLQTSGAPFIAWLERTTGYDTSYVIQWDGTGSQPAATELLQVART